MRITWDKNIEADNKERIESYLEKWSWLCPSWCGQLQVNIKESDGSWDAQINTNYKYRFAVLEIATSWLNLVEYEREATLVHELVHNFYNPMYWYASDTFESLIQNEGFLEVVKESLKTLNESGTQDLTEVLMEKYGREC